MVGFDGMVLMMDFDGLGGWVKTLTEKITADPRMP
jgi:hypothetical protein